MGLVVMILMPFIGVIYILYRVLKDNPDAFSGCLTTTISPLAPIIIALVLSVVIAFAAGPDSIASAAAPLVLIPFGVGACFLFAEIEHREKIKKGKEIEAARAADPDYDKRQRQIKISETEKWMSGSGFTLATRYIEQLVDDRLSPLHGGRNNKTTTTTGECYQWLYYQREFELNRKNIPELSQMLGVPFFDLPESVRSKYLLIHTIMEFEGFTFRGYRSMITVDKHGSYDELKKFLVEYQKTHPESNFNFGY